MRVIAGSAKRLSLKTLEGLDTRPTTDRIKETLFNILQNDIFDICFLDLFSGSGAIGIEALSRGAKNAVFVENNRNAVACIEENLDFTKLASKGEVIHSDVLSALRKLEGHKSFEMIYMDPPYNKEYEKNVLEYLKESSIMYQETTIIIEAALETDFSYLENLTFQVLREKKYKTNKHLFLRKM